MIAIKKQPDAEILKNLNYRQLHQSEQLKPLLCLYIEDTVQKVESRDYTRLQQMVVRYLEQKNRGKHFSSRGRQHEKPASGAAAARRSV